MRHNNRRFSRSKKNDSRKIGKLIKVKYSPEPPFGTSPVDKQSEFVRDLMGLTVPRPKTKNDPNSRFTFSQQEIEDIMWCLGELEKETDYLVCDKLTHARVVAEKYKIQCRIDLAREAGEWI